jgi:acetyl-CoA synthetase
MDKTMTTAIAEVAQRIRALRESCEVSVEEMAKCTGVTVEAYEQLEAGETDFTFTFIYKCASRLGADPTDLLMGQSPTLSEYTVNRQGEGLPIARRKGFGRRCATVWRVRIACHHPSVSVAGCVRTK